jgi:alpha-D-ribose 1-methylphosphonate 5-phosphate C-P lyase
VKPLTLTLLCLALGGVAGAGIALVVWKVADRRLRAEFTTGGSQLATALAAGQGQVSALAQQGAQQAAAAVQTAITTQVVPAVQTTVRAQLAASGITPQLVSDARQVLSLARSAGVIR